MRYALHFYWAETLFTQERMDPGILPVPNPKPPSLKVFKRILQLITTLVLFLWLWPSVPSVMTTLLNKTTAVILKRGDIAKRQFNGETNTSCQIIKRVVNQWFSVGTTWINCIYLYVDDRRYYMFIKHEPSEGHRFNETHVNAIISELNWSRDRMRHDLRDSSQQVTIMNWSHRTLANWSEQHVAMLGKKKTSWIAKN